MSKRNVITRRVVTRYYLYGKGYNSKAAALSAAGSIIVRNMRWAHSRTLFKGEPYDNETRNKSERQWMRERYPCICSEGGCHNSKFGYGCLTARKRDYKRLGELYLDGKIDFSGRSTEPLALPERTQ